MALRIDLVGKLIVCLLGLLVVALFPEEVQDRLFVDLHHRLLGRYLGKGRPRRRSWFDFVENRDGAWLAIADAAGTGPTAAGLGAAALGALRAARRSGHDLLEALHAMHETVTKLGNRDCWSRRSRPAGAPPRERSRGSTATIRPLT
jgi:hypothetical protein